MQTAETTKNFDEYGNFTGTIPQECVRDCSAPGQPADEAVEFWRKELNFQVPRKQAIDYLSQLGAWSREELDEKADEGLAEIVLWIACGDIKEHGEWLGLTH